MSQHRSAHRTMEPSQPTPDGKKDGGQVVSEGVAEAKVKDNETLKASPQTSDATTRQIQYVKHVSVVHTGRDVTDVVRTNIVSRILASVAGEQHGATPTSTASMTQRPQKSSTKQGVVFEEVALKTFVNQMSAPSSGLVSGASKSDVRSGTGGNIRAQQPKAELGIPDLSAINNARHLDQAQTREDNSLGETSKGGKKVTVLNIFGGSGRKGSGNSCSKGPSDESPGKAARRGKNKATPSVRENLTADIPQSVSTDSGIGSPTDAAGGIDPVVQDIDESVADDNPSGSSLMHRTSTVLSNQSNHYRPCSEQDDRHCSELDGLPYCLTADDNSHSCGIRQPQLSSTTTAESENVKGDNVKTRRSSLPLEASNDTKVNSPYFPDVNLSAHTVQTTHPENTGNSRSQSDSKTNSCSLESRETSEVLADVVVPGVCNLPSCGERQRSEVSQSVGSDPVARGLDLNQTVDGGVDVSSVDTGLHHPLAVCDSEIEYNLEVSL